MTTESMCIKLDSAYSEYVIRSAASWTFSALNNFPEISNKSGEWCLVFKEPISSQMKSKFECYINDYRLRELIDSSTNQDRQKIISRALRSVYEQDALDD
jgi:His-Xaa-Ser system protein HxsD